MTQTLPPPADQDPEVVHLRIPGTLYAGLLLAVVLGMTYFAYALLLLLHASGRPEPMGEAAPLLGAAFGFAGGYVAWALWIASGWRLARWLLVLWCLGGVALALLERFQGLGLLVGLPAAANVAVLVLLFLPASRRFFAVLGGARRAAADGTDT